MSLPVVVLAGGRATRLGSVSAQVPKSLVDVAGKPFAVHQIELLRGHGLTDFTFLVGHLGQMIADRLGDGGRWDAHVRYVFDGPRPLGTGGAIRRALPTLGDPFFVIYGDSYLECDYEAVERWFAGGSKSGLMTVYRNDDGLDRSNVLYADGRIVRYDKQHRTTEMRHIDYGLGIFRKAAFSSHSPDEPFDLATVYQELLASDDLASFEVAERFYEIGSLAGLEETRRHLVSKGHSAP